MKRPRILITIVAALIAGTHLIWPAISIDSITLGLIVLAIIPWLAPIFKSIELPGGLKFELQDIKNIEEQADKIGLLANITEVKDLSKYSFQNVAKEDPKLALAGLRIELEDRLRKIAASNNLEVNNKGFGQILRILSEHTLISNEERSVLLDMAATLNSAVHSEINNFDYQTIQWVLEIGPRIITSLDKKVNM